MCHSAGKRFVLSSLSSPLCLFSCRCTAAIIVVFNFCPHQFCPDCCQTDSFYLIIESFFASTNYSLTLKQTIAYLPRTHYVTKLVFRAQHTTSYYYQISHIFAIVWVHSLIVFAKTLPAAHLALHLPISSSTSFEKVL